MKNSCSMAALFFCLCSAAGALGQSNFVRGDSNADGLYNIADPIHALSYLFLGGSAPPCLDAADANDDGLLDVSDGPYSLSFLFTGGPAPKEPFPNCGQDPTDGQDPLTCAEYPPCPQGPTFPHPDPDPCAQAGGPCESALIGPYTMVSAPDADDVMTTATHRDGEVMVLRWTPVVDTDAADLTISDSRGFAVDPIRIDAGMPTLKGANVLAGVTLLLNTLEAAQMNARAPKRGPSENHAGCDPAELMSWADCGDAGKCCDLHDGCIWEECLGDNDHTDMRDCLRQAFDYLACRAFGDTPESCLEQFPQCGGRCSGCHALVVACFALSFKFSLFAPGPSACCARGDCGQPQKCIINGVVMTRAGECPYGDGSYWGDVHLVTFDRLGYDFQGVGEYVVTRALTGDFEVQSRTAPWGASRHVSVTKATAMNVDGDRVAIYTDRTPPLYVNGVPIDLAAPLTLPKGGTVQAAPGRYLVTWTDGSQVQVIFRPGYLSLGYQISSNLRRLMVGLLGNFDGLKDNELTTRDGVTLSSRPTLQDLYNDYGESWRVRQEESLFDYFDGATTETYIDRTFPVGVASSVSLTPEARTAAEAACAAVGVTDPVLLEDCLVDVGFTGEPSFAEATADVAPPDGALGTQCGSSKAAWVNWTKNTLNEVDGSAAGVTVTFHGLLQPGPNLGTGGNVWQIPATTYMKPGIVDNAPDIQDVIALTGGPAAGAMTLTFSSPVVDPVMTLFSIGRPGFQATWNFETPFDIINTGPGYYGPGELTKLDGNVLAGKEGCGIIQFHGVVSTISWTIPVAEYWGGFQVGLIGCR